MAVVTTTLNGPIYLANNMPVPNGVIQFELLGWDVQDGEAVFVSGPFSAQIDENGNFTVELFTNNEGEYKYAYRVSVVYSTPENYLKREVLGIFTLVGPGPYKLADLDIVRDNDPATSFDLLAECRSLLTDSTSQNDAAAASAAAAAASAASAQSAAANRVYRYATKTEMKADTPTAGITARVSSPAPAYYEFKNGDYSAQVAADTWEARYVAADGIPATSGAWVLIIDEAIDMRVYGLSVLETVDWTAAFNHAWNEHYALNAEELSGVLGLSDRINPVTGGRLYGPGSARLTAKALATGSSLVMSCLDTRVHDADNLLIQGITFHGNKDNRPTATDGSGVFNEGTNNRFKDVICHSAVNAGWLMDGNGAGRPCDAPILENCRSLLAGGVGISCATVTDLMMLNTKVLGSGKENLTFDHNSNNADITSCEFGQYKGGAGNLGLDSLGRIRINGGLIDSGNTAEPPVGSRNGICSNSMDHPTPDISVNGTLIQGNLEAGVRVRDRSGSGGFVGGDLTLNGATFRNNGTDVLIEEINGTVMVDAATRLSSVLVSDGNIEDVRFAAGAAAFERKLTANQVINADGNFYLVDFTNQVSNRLTGQVGSEVDLPFGSLWTYQAQLRLTGLAATGGDYATIRITVTEPGRTLTQVKNVDIDGDFLELDLAEIVKSTKATVKVMVRVGGTSPSGTFTVINDNSTYFTGSNLG